MFACTFHSNRRYLPYWSRYARRPVNLHFANRPFRLPYSVLSYYAGLYGPSADPGLLPLYRRSPRSDPQKVARHRGGPADNLLGVFHNQLQAFHLH